MPPSSTPDEVFGLMRSSFALSVDRPVRVAFGDTAGVPAIAAGAESLGTGWDMRQRICAYQDFEERAGDTGGGSWYQRPTLSGLVGSLTSREFGVLQSENASLASRLAPGTIGPQPEQAFRHHATVLTGIIDELAGLDGRDRVVSLYERYERARVEWRIVEQITGAKIGASRWLTPFETGVRLFLESEGWI